MCVFAKKIFRPLLKNKVLFRISTMLGGNRMIYAEQMGQWIKINFKADTATFKTIVTILKTINGKFFNPDKKFWSIPYSKKDEFESKFSKFLIIWADGRNTKGKKDWGVPCDSTIIPYGFKVKPFAHQIEGFNVMVSQKALILADEMGAGKCLDKHSYAQVNDEAMTMEELWEKYADTSTLTYDDEGGEWADSKEKLIVPSLNGEGKLVKQEIVRLYRQRVSENLTKVSTVGGYYATITKRHQLLSENGWSNKIGNFISGVSYLPEGNRKLDSDILELIAWSLTEGYERRQNAMIITQKDKELLRSLAALVCKIDFKYNLDISPQVKYSKNGCFQLYICGKKFKNFLVDMGYAWNTNSAHRSIPTIIQQLDNEHLALFLRHVFDAEGSVGKNLMEITLASEKMLNQIAYLLLRFGIHMTIHNKESMAYNGKRIKRTYFRGNICGDEARKFKELIGFNTGYKSRLLDELCDRPSNPNIDVIPTLKLLQEFKEVTNLPMLHFCTHAIYIKSQNCSRDSAKKVIALLDKIISGETLEKYKLLARSKWTDATLEAYEKLDINYVIEARNKIQNMLDKDLLYLKVTKVEDIWYDDYVYDLEVKDTHNFVGGVGGLMLHNTVQALTAMEARYLLGQIKRVLIITKASLTYNWQNEAAKFTRQKAVVLGGSKNERMKQYADLYYDKKTLFFITSYETYRNDYFHFQQFYWSAMILDESQKVKGWNTKIGELIHEIDADYKYALTGTPIINTPLEAYNILKWLGVEKRDWWTFRNRYAVLGGFNDKEIVGYKNLPELQQKIQNVLLRRLKEDVLDLPPKIRQVVLLEMTASQKKVYKNVKAGIINETLGAMQTGEIHPLVELIRLKQCTSSIRIFEGIEVSDDEHSVKINTLKEYLEDICISNKAVVFTQFKTVVKILLKDKEILKYNPAVITGDVHSAARAGENTSDRQRQVDKFQNDSSCRLFIGTLGSCREGLTLTEGNYVFFLDEEWAEAYNQQGEDRCMRIGQQKTVNIYRFRCKDTIDEIIGQVLLGKEEMFDNIIDMKSSGATPKMKTLLQDILKVG